MNHSATHSATHRSNTVMYVVIGTVLLLLIGVAMFSFLSNRESERATAKAEQLSAELAAAGMRVPTTEQISRVLGDSGGSVCVDPGDSLRRSVLYGMLTNGAAGPGQRPVIADNNVLHGQLLIMKVYCPQYLEQLQEIANDLRTANVASGRAAW
jgi:Tfp pilus assembly protein FimT